VTEPYTPRQAAAIVGASALITALSGLALRHWDGWTSWIAGPAFFLGFLMTLGSISGWYDARHPSAPERRAAFALTFLALFFACAAILFGWLYLSPDSGCADCSTTGGRITAAAFQLLFWGMTAACLVRLARLRRN
jgi:hypothetical protein